MLQRNTMEQFNANNIRTKMNIQKTKNFNICKRNEAIKNQIEVKNKI